MPHRWISVNTTSRTMTRTTMTGSSLGRTRAPILDLGEICRGDRLRSSRTSEVELEEERTGKLECACM